MNNKSIRNIIRVLFLVIFFTLWMVGKAELWGQLLLLGLLVVPIGGRLYCGYLCPISTTIDILGFIKPAKKLSEEHKKLFFNNKIRAVIFLVSIALLVITIKSQSPVPFFVILVPIGVVFTYLFGEAAWHRNCFIGTMYSWLGGLSRRGYIIPANHCSACGSCEKVCPAGCLEISPARKKIENKQCLICGKCQVACPKENIYYGSLKKAKAQDKTLDIGQ